MFGCTLLQPKTTTNIMPTIHIFTIKNERSANLYQHFFSYKDISTLSPSALSTSTNFQLGGCLLHFLTTFSIKDYEVPHNLLFLLSFINAIKYF